MAIRSGRFRAKITNLATGITIIKGRDESFYRIFNSGVTTWLKVKHKGTDVVLQPTFSVDVATKGAGANGELVITATTVDEVVEGIYDYLDTQNPIRSGRFSSIKKLVSPGGAADDPTKPHEIIVFPSGSPTVWYRIFNSGENKIILEGGTTSSGEIEKGQSLDIAVKGETIKVKSGGTNQDHIEGIYEFLGKG